MNRLTLSLLTSLVLIAVTLSVVAQSSAITYQGRLQQSGEPFNGDADLRFQLFDSLTGGTQIGPNQTRNNWPVNDGLFQVDLDFGETAFDGSARFLEVRVNGTNLTPRQAVRAAPIALYALNGNPGPEGPQGPEGASPFVLAGDGSISYQVDDALLEFAPSTDLLLGGRLVVGHVANEASGQGAVVLGGGEGPDTGPARANIASGRKSIVAGGSDNIASGASSLVIGSESSQALGSHAAVLGGRFNAARFGRSIVVGGSENIATGSWSLAAGRFTCAGGTNSWAIGYRAKVRYRDNFEPEDGPCFGVPTASELGGDGGTFVWSDRQEQDFVSSGSNQFLVRAGGGVLLTPDSSVNNPDGNALRVNGTVRVDDLGSAGSVLLCRNSDDQIAACSSSARYKKDIQNVDLELDAIMQLRPVRYRWIADDSEDVGLVAEEVAEAIPALVTYNKGGQVEGVKYPQLAALLVGVVQRQAQEIELLREQLSRLERRLTAVEQRDTKIGDSR